MIRVAHISDSHFDERGRLQDVIAVHQAFLQQAADAKVDVIVHAGDWFERRSTPAERMAVADFLEGAAAMVAPVFGVKGNHDAAMDLALFPRLDRTRVTIMDRPTAAPGSAWMIGTHHGTLAMLALPWFDRVHLASSLDVSVDQEAVRNLTIEAARGLLTAVRHEAQRARAAGAVPILVGHVLVQGSEVSTGQTLIGTTVELAPADLLEVGAAYAALGHVHMTQTWFDGRVAYSGSPHRCSFGEPEAKGWRLVTLTDDGEFVSNEFRELPARRVELLEVDWTKSDMLARLREHGISICFALSQSGRVRGALVRFRYRIRAEDLHLVDANAIEKILTADGAAEVKVEAIVDAATRARAPEIVRVASLVEKVDAYLGAKKISVDDAQRDRIRAKVGALEGEQHAAL